jgi:hypothetical protein
MRSAAAATPNQSRVLQYAQMPRNGRQRDAKRPSQFRNATFALSGKTLQDAAPSRIRERGKNRRNRLSFIKQRLKPNSSKKQSQYDYLTDVLNVCFTARGNPMEVSVRVGREMLLEVTKQEAVEMQRCSGAFVDGVGAVRVLHKIDGLVEFDQAVEQ